MIDALGRPQSLLVLGGTSEIALATAGRFVDGGLRRVALVGRDPDALAAAARALSGSAPADLVVTTQVLDAVDIAGHGPALQAMFDSSEWDVVLVAVGVLGDAEQLDQAPEAAVAGAAVTYLGAVSLTAHAARLLSGQGHGVLVVLSSVAAVRPRMSNPVYGSAKAGLDGFALALGDRVRPRGVDVVVVRPGFVRTRMSAGLDEAPLSVDAADVADAVVGAVAHPRPVVWVPPALRVLALALRHLPRPVFRRLPR